MTVDFYSIFQWEVKLVFWDLSEAREKRADDEEFSEHRKTKFCDYTTQSRYMYVTHSMTCTVKRIKQFLSVEGKFKIQMKELFIQNRICISITEGKWKQIFVRQICKIEAEKTSICSVFALKQSEDYKVRNESFACLKTTHSNQVLSLTEL